MNESMVYADNFSKTFAGEGDFLNFLKNREEETTWKNETSSSLRFEARTAHYGRDNTGMDGCSHALKYGKPCSLYAGGFPCAESVPVH